MLLLNFNANRSKISIALFDVGILHENTAKRSITKNILFYCRFFKKTKLIDQQYIYQLDSRRNSNDHSIAPSKQVNKRNKMRNTPDISLLQKKISKFSKIIASATKVTSPRPTTKSPLSPRVAALQSSSSSTSHHSNAATTSTTSPRHQSHSSTSTALHHDAVSSSSTTTTPRF